MVKWQRLLKTRSSVAHSSATLAGCSQPEPREGKEDGQQVTPLCSLADGRSGISLKTAQLGESGNKAGARSRAKTY